MLLNLNNGHLKLEDKIRGTEVSAVQKFYFKTSVRKKFRPQVFYGFTNTFTCFEMPGIQFDYF